MLNWVIKELDARPYLRPIACAGETALAKAHAKSLLEAGFKKDKAFFESEAITVYVPPLTGTLEWVGLCTLPNNFLYTREQLLSDVLSQITGHHGLTDALAWTEVDAARFPVFVEALPRARAISKEEGAAALLEARAV